MNWLRNLSIRRKLTLVILVMSLSVLSLACTGLIAYELVTSRQAMVEDRTLLADVLGRSSAPMLDLNTGVDEAEKQLSGLSAEPSVSAACLYAKDGTRFADYLRPGTASEFPRTPPTEPVAFRNGLLEVTRPVTIDDRQVGTIFIRSDANRINDRLRTYLVIVGVVVVVALVITAVLSSLVQRLIANPVLRLAATARLVSENKDYSVRAKKSAADEIGQLTDAVNEMLAEIEAGQQALQAANRSLEGRSGELEAANRSLEAQAAQLAEAAGVLATASREILELSTRAAASAAETAVAVTQATTTVQEVKHTALVSSQRTQHVSEGAKRVAEISRGGQQSTELTVAGMNRIREQMRSIAQSMMGLSDQAQTISGIIASVDDLAQQSNLLAVNAAIEAAKAGEHGRGFAVVAQEIKNLAEQSRQATTQVRTILGDVQRSTNAAVMATEQGSKAVEAGVQQSNEAGRAIVSLAANVAEAAEAAVQIAASSQQQLAGMDQVAQAMESVRQGSVQNASSAKQLEASAQNLGDVGKRLQDLLQSYQAAAAGDGKADGKGKN